jgi:hypothetical protein
MHGDNIYTVEAIGNHRGKPGNYQFKIKWLGYPESENSWISGENIFHANLIHDYFARIGKAIPWKKPKDSSKNNKPPEPPTPDDNVILPKPKPKKGGKSRTITRVTTAPVRIQPHRNRN